MDNQNNIINKQQGQGKNALVIRHQNELAVINYLRHNGSGSRTDLAKDLGVTSQALATISEKLVDKELIKNVGKHYPKGPGQPPTIYQLNPDGAFSVGLNIGRSHTDIMLVDFCGASLARERLEYDSPDPDEIVAYLADQHKKITGSFTKQQQKRYIGVGMSMPYYIDKWGKELGYSADLMKRWEGFAMQEQLTKKLGVEVLADRDTTASAVGEVFFGKPPKIDSFVYIYIGTFPGGGLIMDKKLVSGNSDNAGSIGSMLVPAGKLLPNEDGQMVQCLYRAGLYALRKYLETKGYSFDGFTELFESLSTDKEIIAHGEEWVEDAAEALAYVAISSNALMDFKAIVIDGSLPEQWLQKIIARSEYYYDHLENRGITKPEFYQGTHGVDARSLGSAALPLYRIFGTS